MSGYCDISESGIIHLSNMQCNLIGLSRQTCKKANIHHAKNIRAYSVLR